jgi:hypothetical protein
VTQGTGGSATTGGAPSTGGAVATGGSSATGGTTTCPNGMTPVSTTVVSISWTESTSRGGVPVCSQYTFSEPQIYCVGYYNGTSRKEFSGPCSSDPPSSYPVGEACTAPAEDIASVPYLQDWTLNIYYIKNVTTMATCGELSNLIL